MAAQPRFTFTLPRRTDGRFYVQIIEQKPRGDGTFELDMYPLKDEHGDTRSFATPTEAWDAVKKWEADQAKR